MNATTIGWINGIIGMLIFSGSLPATRAAVAEFDPVFLTAARAVIAAALGGLMLLALRQKRPERGDLASLAITSFGVVLGFPLLTALALQYITSAHSLVFIGLLPLATATFGVLRGGERPQPMFWLFSVIGAALVAGFALSQSGGGSLAGDLLMVGAIIVCGLGYAEGGALSRRLGGWQVISWALLLGAPFMAVLGLATWPAGWSGISMAAWAGFAYVSTFSMLIGFIFWYRGLALGGIAGVGQLQLIQPFFGMMLAAALLGETVALSMIGVTAMVVLCVAGARRYA